MSVPSSLGLLFKLTDPNNNILGVTITFEDNPKEIRHSNRDSNRDSNR